MELHLRESLAVSYMVQVAVWTHALAHAPVLPQHLRVGGARNSHFRFGGVAGGASVPGDDHRQMTAYLAQVMGTARVG